MNTGRYIDARPIQEKLRKRIELYKGKPHMMEKLFGLQEGYAAVHGAPTADVAPVVHAQWNGTVCSACGESTSFYFDCDYCPCCGAKMDGNGDDNNAQIR